MAQRGGCFILKKTRQLLLPAIVIGGIFALVNGRTAHVMLTDIWKGGYWFMLTLFEYMVAQTIVECLTSGKGVDRTSLRYAATLILMTSVLSVLSVHPVYSHFGITGDIIQLSKLRYFIYFAAGRLVRIHMIWLLQWRWRDLAVALIIVTFIALAIGSWAHVGIGAGSGVLYYFRFALFEMTALLSVFFFFYRQRAWFASGGGLPRTLAYVGRHTLEIYMLHYFLLPKDLQAVGRYFTEHPAPIVELLVAGVIAIAIAAICLLIGEIIRSSRFLHHWVLGGK